MEPNLAGSIYVRSSIKLLHLVPFGQQTWPPRLILFFYWLMLKQSSSLKQLGQMEPNLARSIYVRSSIKFLHFVPFHQQIWPPRAILVSDWLLFKQIFSSETAWQNGTSCLRRSRLFLMPLIDIGIEVIFQTILLVFLPLAYFAFEGVDVPHLSSGYWYSIFVVNTKYN